MKASYTELMAQEISFSNNYLKHHGYVMQRGVMIKKLKGFKKRVKEENMEFKRIWDASLRERKEK